MTTPVRYGEHERAVPGTSCLLCGEFPFKPVVDHCHVHGWVRGTLCPRCNTLMAFIDQRASLRTSTLAGQLTLAALVAHAARCPDCEPFSVEDLGPTRGLASKTPSNRVTVMLRVPVSLKSWLAAQARERGLSVNAAAIVLLDRQLTDAGHPLD